MNDLEILAAIGRVMRTVCLSHIGKRGAPVPVKNTRKQDCYDALDAIDQVLRQRTEPTNMTFDVADLETLRICGFTAKELVLFALACREKGIDDWDLKDFATSCERAYEAMWEHLERSRVKLIRDATQIKVVVDASPEEPLGRSIVPEIGRESRFADLEHEIAMGRTGHEN